MKVVYLLSALLLLSHAKGLFLVDGSESEHYDKQFHSPGVAIVGAGIGGAFTAYNLRDLLNQSVDLHV